MPMTEQEMAHKHHMDYWCKVRERASQTLARVCESAAPETKREAVEMLAYALRCGNATDKAECIAAVAEWVHSDDEIWYKKSL